MVSVKTLEQTDDIPESLKNTDSRSGIDLVCVIDNSGSMLRRNKI